MFSSPKTLNVVILAAGRGERFAAAGVTVPKPLIEFRGTSLIQHSIHVAHELRRGGGRIIVVATPQVAALSATKVDVVVPVSVTQPGPIGSAILALAHLPLLEPVVFMDCDNYFPSEQRSWTAEVPCGETFLVVADKPANTDPRDFLNVDLPDGGRVSRIAEKTALNGRPKFGCGIYGFETAQMFRAHAFNILSSIVKEPPMSAVTEAIHAQYSVAGVVAEAWLPIGTPAQLMEALHVPQGPTTNE